MASNANTDAKVLPFKKPAPKIRKVRTAAPGLSMMITIKLPPPKP